MGMSPRGGIAAPVIQIKRLQARLSTTLDQQRNARDEQQREHDFSEDCLVNSAKQLETKPGSTQQTRHPHHEEFSCFRGDVSLRPKPERAHQKDRDRDRLEHRAHPLASRASCTRW